MDDRRKDTRRERDKCPNIVTCPTSEREMDEVRDRLDSGGKKMEEIYKGIKKNRCFDIAILILGIFSLIVNLHLQGVF